MWIRSQEGKRLVRCEALTVWGPRANTGLFEVSGYIGPEPDEGGFLLGEYPTEAEALKVLDYIHHQIEALEYYRHYGKDSGMSCPDFVFQMPEAGFSEEESHG